MRHLIAGLGLATLPAVPAAAHDFGTDGGAYDLFVEGMSVVLTYPSALFPLLSLGLLLSLWHPEGMVRAWPVLFLGQAAGLVLAPAVGAWILPVTLGAGAAVAALAAVLNRHAAWEAIGLAAITATLVSAVSFEGHGLFELPAAIHIGILFAMHVATAVAAGLAKELMVRVPAFWTRIAVRVAASWLAASLVLILAFELRGPLQ